METRDVQLNTYRRRFIPNMFGFTVGFGRQRRSGRPKGLDRGGLQSGCTACPPSRRHWKYPANRCAMRTPERPFDGDSSGDGAPSYEWLDEWLCEYVDGTMDPSMEAVFEQYVEANPELRAHVKRLHQTREILCGCDLPEGKPADFQQGDGAETTESEASPVSVSSPEPDPEGPSGPSTQTAGIAASIAVALVVGFLAGSVLVDPATLSSPTGEAKVVEADGPSQEKRRKEALPQPGRSASAPESRASSGEAFRPEFSTSSATGADTVAIPSALTTLEDW